MQQIEVLARLRAGLQYSEIGKRALANITLGGTARPSPWNEAEVAIGQQGDLRLQDDEVIAGDQLQAVELASRMAILKTDPSLLDPSATLHNPEWLAAQRPHLARAINRLAAACSRARKIGYLPEGVVTRPASLVNDLGRQYLLSTALLQPSPGLVRDYDPAFYLSPFEIGHLKRRFSDVTSWREAIAKYRLHRAGLPRILGIMRETGMAPEPAFKRYARQQRQAQQT